MDKAKFYRFLHSSIFWQVKHSCESFAFLARLARYPKWWEHSECPFLFFEVDLAEGFFFWGLPEKTSWTFFSNEPKGNLISPRHYGLPVAYRFSESEIWSTSIFLCTCKLDLKFVRVGVHARLLIGKSHKLAIAMMLTVLRRDDVDVRIETIAWILSVLSCIFWDRSEYMAFENATGLLP